MAAEDVFIQHVIWKKILPFLGAIAFIWYFRRRLLQIMSSIYKRIFAWAINMFTNRMNRSMWHKKEELFQPIHDLQRSLERRLVVLEIGAGSAANLEFYPKHTRLICLDPNPHFEPYIDSRVETADHRVRLDKFILGYAEDIPLESGSVDAVVSTLVLCSVSDVSDCLSEIRRVLRPDGTFVFLEHTIAQPGTFLRRIQMKINPVWRIIGDGCNVTRDTKSMIEDADFSHVSIKQSKFKWWMFVIRPYIMGVAYK